ncbi:MAG TPA: ABC transporter permease [Cellulomonas sp.]|nr:ABC transporter permease [Cellulomonas sp.]
MRDIVALARLQAGLVVGSARTQVLLQMRHPMTIVAGTVTPLLFTAVSVLPRTVPLTGPEATQAVTGSLLAAFWAGSVWGGVSILRRDRSERTLAPTLTGVAPAAVTLMARTVGCTALAIAAALPAQLLAVVLFRLNPVILHPGVLIGGLVLVVVSGTAACFLLSTLMVISRFGFQITSALGPPMLLLGGTVLPTDQLPAVLQPLSWLISLSWLQRLLSSTASPSVDGTAALVACLLTVAYLVVGLSLFRRALRRARQEATLELV